MSASGGASPMATSNPLATRVEAVLAGLDRRAQVLQLFLVGGALFRRRRGRRAGVQGVTTLGEGLPNARTIAVQPMWDASDYSGSVTKVLKRHQERCRVGRWQYSKIAKSIGQAAQVSAGGPRASHRGRPKGSCACGQQSPKPLLTCRWWSGLAPTGLPHARAIDRSSAGVPS